MNQVTKLVCLLALVGIVCVNAFGWGNATHVYFAHHLGAKVGVMDAAEMYGVLLPDLFDLAFDVPYYDLLTAEMHYNYRAALNAAIPWRLRAEAFAIALHNEDWGADSTAHIGGSAPYPHGYVIDQAIVFSPEVYAYLNDSLGLPSTFPTGVTLQELAVLLSHSIIESAVDILVREKLDPLVGLRMAGAAKGRQGDTWKMLADAYGSVLREKGVDEATIRKIFLDAEKAYQKSMIQYGELYTLPKAQLIAVLSAFSAQMGQSFIFIVTGGTQVVIDPAQVATFLGDAMTQVAPTYAAEIAMTMDAVGGRIESLHLQPEYPMFADAEAGLNSEISGTTVPVDFSLGQNYPNPFNPSTAISYVLPKDCFVTLKVYNSIGQEVATLADGPESAGPHTIHWNASTMASGVYLYRITAGEFTSVKRLTLVK